MQETWNFLVQQSSANGIFCLLFVILFAFTMWDSKRREVRFDEREEKLVQIINNFKTELQKITECLNRLLNK